MHVQQSPAHSVSAFDKLYKEVGTMVLLAYYCKVLLHRLIRTGRVAYLWRMPHYLKADDLKISLRGLQACQVQAAALQKESGSAASVVRQQVKEIAGWKSMILHLVLRNQQLQVFIQKLSRIHCSALPQTKRSARRRRRRSSARLQHNTQPWSSGAQQLCT